MSARPHNLATPQADVRLLEELAANAWPAEVVQFVDGWRLRYTHGVTRRANSVLPHTDGGTLSLDERLRLVEQFYARRGARALFQVSPGSQPSDLEALLRGRGYVEGPRDATFVETAALRPVLDATTGSGAEGVRVTERLEPDWLKTYAAAGGLSPEALSYRRDIIQRIGPRVGFAVLVMEGQPAAVGMGVAERGWLGIFSMATLSAFRRRGAARAILHALGRWGVDHAAHSLYLQVAEENQAARDLYRSVGFQEAYTYHYLTPAD